MPQPLFDSRFVADFALGGENLFVATVGAVAGESPARGHIRKCDREGCTSDDVVATFPDEQGAEIKDVRKLGVSDDRLYWLDEARMYGHQKLYSSKLDGTQQVTVADLGQYAHAGRLVPDGDTLLVSTTGRGLLRVLRDEATRIPYGVTNIDVQIASSDAVALDTNKSHFAFWHPIPGRDTAPIQIQPRAPGERLSMGAAATVPNTGLLLSEKAVFWVDGNELKGCSLESACVEPKLIAKDVAPALASDGRRLIFHGVVQVGDKTAGAFQSCGLDEAVAGSCNPVVQLSGFGEDVTKLGVDGRFFYALSSEGLFSRFERKDVQQ